MENRSSNEYFEEMEHALEVRSITVSTLKDVKNAYKEKFGFESDAYKAASEMYHKACEENKYNRGQITALRSWQYGYISDTEVKAIDSLFDGDVKDFVEALREAGIKRFWYSHRSTAAVDNFFDFLALGCSFDGTEERKDEDNPRGRANKGIWFKL